MTFTLVGFLQIGVAMIATALFFAWAKSTERRKTYKYIPVVFILFLFTPFGFPLGWLSIILLFCFYKPEKPDNALTQ